MPHRAATADEVRELQQALERREFILVYQPKVDMRRGRVVGVEALVRWQHPQRGLLQPDSFIPLIASHALVERLGDWALGEALQQAARWQAQGRALSVSVNVSPQALLQPGFVAGLHAALVRHPQLGAGALELEILETTGIDDLPATAAVVAQCEALGVAVTLDDFGTGHASLAWLRQLPVTAFKLDQCFVRGILHSEADRVIVRGLLAIAQGLGCQAIAEGVESVAHGDALLALGCTLGQGFGIGRPMPPDALPAWAAAFEQVPPWAVAPTES